MNHEKERNMKESRRAVVGAVPYLCGPYMNTLVEASRREEFPVRREGHRVDRFRVFGEGVYARPPVHVPKPHRRVK